MPRNGSGLRMVSVKVPEAYYEAIMLLVKKGIYANFSEAVRAALSLLTRREAELAALLAIIREQERALEERDRILSLQSIKSVERSRG